MPRTISIRSADLLVDIENPRIPYRNAGQRETLRAIAEHQNEKILVLAEDIVAHGLNPSDLPITMQSEDQPGRYVVLEGNRRLTALRALENSDLFVDAIAPGILARIRKLSATYQHAPVAEVTCVVMKDREEADHWIYLRHNGPLGGRGIVVWESEAKGRFRAQSGRELELHTRILNFLETGGHMTRAEREHVPTTSFKRLIETPEVRSAIGLEVERDGGLAFRPDENAVIKALLYIARDLSSGTTKVRKIYTKDQRVDYANSLPADLVSAPVARSAVGTQPAVAGGIKRTSLAKLKRQRDKLIPTDCILKIPDPKLRRIGTELRDLSLKDHTNAVTVLFRVFVELSADYYLETMKVTTPTVHDALTKKLTAVADHLHANNKLSDQARKPVRLACQKGSYLSPSVVLMHEYIHNLHMIPAPSDLRAHWDSLQPFVMAIWPP